jgi:DNA-binding response OmpR family regulator
VVLSALDAVDGKIRALELGADDYLVKPVESCELCSSRRVQRPRSSRSWLRRSPRSEHRASGAPK